MKKAMGTKIILLVQLHIVIPSTHWLVTETGKIEAQPDSIFFMKQPNDLVSFLHQEQRYADMNSLHDKLASFRFLFYILCDVDKMIVDVLEESWMTIRAWRFLTWRAFSPRRILTVCSLVGHWLSLVNSLETMMINNLSINHYIRPLYFHPGSLHCHEQAGDPEHQQSN